MCLSSTGDVLEICAVLPELKSVYDPFLNMLQFIDKHIAEKVVSVSNLSKKDAAACLRDDPFMKWILRNEHFDALLDKNPKINLSFQIQTIEKAALYFPDIMFTPSCYKPVIQSVPVTWVRQGCLLSTDVDIVIFSNENLFSAEYDISEIQALFPDKSIDINVVIVVNGVVTRVRKGIPSVTNNSIFSTYSNFDQKFPNPIARLVDLDVASITRIVSLTLLNNLTFILPSYNRKDKAFMTELYSNKNKYIVEMLHKIIPIDTAEFRDNIKSLVMKICQVLLYFSAGEEAYNKIELAEKSAFHLNISGEGLLWFLFRGSKGVFDDSVMPGLANLYKIMLENIFQLNWEPFPLKLTNPISKLSESVYSLFLHSPTICSDEFADEYLKKYGTSFHDLFVTQSDSLEKFPSWLRQNIEEVNQRSDAWKNLLTFYTCGTNNGIVQPGRSFIHTYYNLFRGCVTEAIVSNSFNDSKYESRNIGMLVMQKDVPKSQACSPDVLLIDKTNGDVFPVEIKCITGEKNSSKYFRALDLGKKQLRNALEIICSLNPLQQKKGLFILVYAGINGFKAESLWGYIN